MGKHDEHKNAKGGYTCPRCGEDFTHAQGLGKHIAAMHPTKEDMETATTAAPSAPSNGGHMMPVYRPMSPESAAIRETCNAAIAILMLPHFAKLTPERKRDVLAVVRARLFEEDVMAAAVLSSDELPSLDPLARPS